MSGFTAPISVWKSATCVACSSGCDGNALTRSPHTTTNAGAGCIALIARTAMRSISFSASSASSGVRSGRKSRGIGIKRFVKLNVSRFTHCSFEVPLIARTKPNWESASWTKSYGPDHSCGHAARADSRAATRLRAAINRLITPRDA
jgi:hypothetical protein